MGRGGQPTPIRVRGYDERTVDGGRYVMKKLLIVLGILLGFGLAFAAGILLQPAGAKPVMPPEALEFSLEDGTLRMGWAEQLDIESCKVDLYSEADGSYVSLGTFSKGDAILDGVTAGQEVRLRILPIRITKNLLGLSGKKEGEQMETAVVPVELPTPILSGEVDEVDKSIFLSADNKGEYGYEVCILDENGVWQPVGESYADTICLYATQDFDILGGQDKVSIAARTLLRTGYTSYSAMSEPVEIGREELFGQLDLTYEKTGDRRYVLHWSSVGGEYSEVQQWKDGSWETMAVLGAEETAYDLGTLHSGNQERFRVISYDTQEKRDAGELAAEPYEISFRVAITPIYCTVWPLTDLKLYADPYEGGAIGTMPVGQALCVLESENGFFRVRWGDQYGYVDENFCLIDLAEYFGDLCDYDIKNSYSSIFKVHEYDTPGLTDVVIQGYEDICLSEGEYLVPFLYPCARKLRQAAETVRKDGYGLRIYDAFRPNEASRYMYSTMSALMGKVIPETENTTDKTENGQSFKGEQTWQYVMTNNQYGLSSFLARTVSAHNRGIALDLTLEKLSSGRDLEMQTNMHDLSWHSAITYNNENADLLADYMMNAGFNDLFSEWWHFQDNETWEALGTNTYVKEGLNCAGWKKDDTGWRYRTENGTYLYSTTKNIDGTDYTFDADGYCAQYAQDE